MNSLNCKLKFRSLSLCHSIRSLEALKFALAQSLTCLMGGLNFTKAAEELFISQPAVSKYIRETESYYKVKIFDRNGTRKKLTQAGSLLFQHARRLDRYIMKLKLTWRHETI